MASHVVIYKEGPLALSVCAPVDMKAGEVADAVNRARPPGTSAGWHVSADKTFATGETMPAPCDKRPAARRHWLLDC